jgi:sugar phosphate isomerase/epimerase
MHTAALQLRVLGAVAVFARGRLAPCFCFDSHRLCVCYSGNLELPRRWRAETLKILMKFASHLGAALGAGLLVLAGLPAPAAPSLPEDCKIGGIAIGCQAYSFNRFTLFEAIEKTEQAGGKTIELFPRQKLSKEEPAITFNHDAPDEVIQKVKDKLAKHKIRVVNYGVVGGKDEAEWRKIFQFAKKLDLYGITTEDVKNIDIIEKLVKEFDVHVGYHEHRRKDNDASYKLWDPNYIVELTKGRDSRIGACADTGHWATSGLQPLDCIKILKGRIVSLHLKERTEIGKQQPDTIYGQGVTNIKGILDELQAQGFKGHISIEYENNWDHSVPDIAQCIGYVRGYLDSKKK